MPTWVELLLGALAALVVVWALLLVTLAVAAPDRGTLREVARVLPDLLRLLTRLARDPAVPRGARVRLWLLLAYLASPVDLVPDVVPVIGYLDDAVVAVLVLRSVVRRAGPGALDRHWPGTPDGLRAVRRLAGLDGSDGTGSDGTGSDGTGSGGSGSSGLR